MEKEILMEAKVCPHCCATVTVAQLAFQERKDNGKTPKDAFVFLEAKPTMLENPMLAGVAVDGIVTYYDVCAHCGTYYATRSEKIKIPVTGQMQQPPNNNKPGRN